VSRTFDWRPQAARAVLSAARISQALVIEALDCAVGRPAGHVRRAVARVSLSPLPLGGLDEPARAADEAYDLTIQLLRLHREFVQRLFEALAAFTDSSASTDQSEDLPAVIALATARKRLHHNH